MWRGSPPKSGVIYLIKMPAPGTRTGWKEPLPNGSVQINSTKVVLWNHSGFSHLFYIFFCAVLTLQLSAWGCKNGWDTETTVTPGAGNGDWTDLTTGSRV